MAAARILIIQGHPDPSGEHFCHALADSYGGAATAGCHEVKTKGGRRERWLAALARLGRRGG